jgi:hypothetical protein
MAASVNFCTRLASACCCVEIEESAEAPTYMMHQNTSQPLGPSLYSRLCWCQWSPVPRNPSGLEEVEQLRGLVGIRLQGGADHATSGTLATSKCGDYNKETRTYRMAPFGSFYQKDTTGLWTEPAGDCLGTCLAFVGRTANYTYEYQFSEDFQSAQFTTSLNIAVVCCCCCPCIPAWFTLPSWLCTNTMEQAEDSEQGDHWVRKRGRCGRTPTYYYDLFTVWTHDGKETRFTSKVASVAPKQVIITF